MKRAYPALLAMCVASSVSASDLVITEIMQNPSSVSDSSGEWFEILNTGTNNIDLSGWIVSDNDSDSFTIAQSVIVPAGQYIVLGNNADTATNGGVGVGYTYSGMSLANGSDELVLTDPSGQEVDRVEWDNGATFPDPNGASMVLNSASSDNNDGTNWSTSSSIFGAGDAGTPGTGPDGSAAEPDDTPDDIPDDTPGDDGGTPDDSPQDPNVISGQVCTNCPDLSKVADAQTFDAASYYANAQTEVDLGSSAALIKNAITSTISSGQTVLSYSEVWTALTFTDEDPANSDNVILWYSNRSQAKSTNGSGSASSNPDNWNREHSWPSSHGFSDRDNEAFTDLHHLRATDISINGSRGNLDFDNSDSPLSESPINRIDSDSFEPRDDIKGDVARMMFYMDTRYQGSGSDVTPDLQLVNRITSTGQPELGFLCTLIGWHQVDPVDDAEQLRNSRIYELQGNRNPYIDNPTWVANVYDADTCASVGGDDPAPDDGGDDTPDPVEPEPDAGAPSSLIFINEIHYDNAGADVGERVEIAGLAGADLTGMSLVLYNGRNGQNYSTTDLTGAIPSQQNGFGTVSFDVGSLQNGAPDGLALVDAQGVVLQFLSYEGEFEATDGPALGLTSTDIGVAESSSSNAGESLQLVGNGFMSSDFTWQAPVADSFGSVNSGQTFVLPSPFINEIHYDNSGADIDEGIEIAGVAGLDLSGMSIVLYNGRNGTQYSTTPLTGTISDQQQGFGTLFFAISGIQNGAPDGLALVDASGRVVQFLSYEGEFEGTDGPALGLTSEDIGVSEASSTTVGDSLQLSGSGVVYTDFSWQGATANTFGDVNTGQAFGLGSAGGDTGGDAGGDGGTVSLGQCADPATLISQVQGAGDTSPLVDQTVIVEGVVTTVFEDLGGFFVQQAVSEYDNDPMTSEGVYVSFTGEFPASGERVRLLGTVSEFFARTQVNVTEPVLNCGTGSVEPTRLTLPFVSLAAAEALEGMLVSSAQELVVTNNFTLARFGQVTLSSQRLFNPTNQFLPGSVEAVALAEANVLDKIVLDDGINFSNPDPVIFPTGGLSAVNTLRSGDIVTNLVGPVDFSFGQYRVVPIQAPTFVNANPRTDAPELDLGNLTIGSLNVLNYFNTPDNSGSICGPTGSSGCRGADNAEEFDRQQVKTVAALVAMDADIVGLMEIENNGFGESAAITDLVTRLNQALGEGTYTALSSTGPIGTDAITVALIYKSAVVQPVGELAILTSQNSITDEQGPLFNDGRNRPSLAQKFVLNANGEELVVSVSHLKSKGSGCGAGDDDTTTGQGNCNLTRTRAAQALTAFLSNTFADAPTLILGDLNAYAKEQPIQAIEQAGYTNLINKFNGDSAYSFAFNGEFGYLDHALGNALATEKVVDVTEWHINADEPIALDYNTEFKSDAQLTDFFAPDPYRMSDHDPVMIAMQLDPTAVQGDLDGDGDVDINDVRGVIRAVQTRQPIGLEFDFTDDGVVNILDVRAMFSLCSRARCAP